jgi:hypothetical protein
MTDFPVPGLLVRAPKKKKWPLGKRTYSANRGNDITWWMGPVRYYAQVETMGEVVVPSSITMSDSSSFTVSFPSSGYSSGTQMKACVFYAYSNMNEYRSNPACQTFNIP